MGVVREKTVFESDIYYPKIGKIFSPEGRSSKVAWRLRPVRPPKVRGITFRNRGTPFHFFFFFTCFSAEICSYVNFDTFFFFFFFRNHLCERTCLSKIGPLREGGPQSTTKKGENSPFSRFLPNKSASATANRSFLGLLSDDLSIGNSGSRAAPAQVLKKPGWML